jgi:hypothetical protein
VRPRTNGRKLPLDSREELCYKSHTIEYLSYKSYDEDE